jgi:hypothetical protein
MERSRLHSKLEASLFFIKKLYNKDKKSTENREAWTSFLVMLLINSI